MKRTAFTLIELLVVIAIIAILAAILFPVFAQAKAAAKIASSLSNVKEVGLGLAMYATDADDMSVPHYGYGTPTDTNQYHNNTTWVGRIYPYVKNRDVFFDATKSGPKEDTTINGVPMFKDPFYGSGYEYRWEWATNLSLNADGYSYFTGGSCTAPSGSASMRSQTSFSDPARRLAVAPTRYANLSYGWEYFLGRSASWPYIDIYYTSGWSWYNLVWDARREYNAKMVGAYADGHAAKFGREKFVAYYYYGGPNEAATTAQYCTQMTNRELDKFWGPVWDNQ